MQKSVNPLQLEEKVEQGNVIVLKDRLDRATALHKEAPSDMLKVVVDDMTANWQAAVDRVRELQVRSIADLWSKTLASH